MVHIVILSNSFYLDNILFLGLTKQTPKEKAHQLYTSSRDVPAPFKVEYFIELDDKKGEALFQMIRHKIKKYLLENKNFVQLSKEKLFQLLTNELKIKMLKG